MPSVTPPNMLTTVVAHKTNVLVNYSLVVRIPRVYFEDIANRRVSKWPLTPRRQVDRWGVCMEYCKTRPPKQSATEVLWLPNAAPSWFVVTVLGCVVDTGAKVCE